VVQEAHRRIDLGVAIHTGTGTIEASLIASEPKVWRSSVASPQSLPSCAWRIA
jgi:hypothetical protein